MFEQDYLMRILVQFADAIRRSMEKATGDQDPRSAANQLEEAVGQATDIDGEVLLSLAPESIASVMQVSGVDPRVTEYIARSLVLSASYLDQAGDTQLADVRRQQADAIAAAYGLDVPHDVERIMRDLPASEEEGRA